MTKLGVTIQTKTLVTNIVNDVVTIKQGDEVKEIGAKTVLWAADVKASPLGKILTELVGAECDRATGDGRT